MGSKLKAAGWISVGVLAGALTTVSVQTVARGVNDPLPLDQLQQFAAVYGMIKSSYVEPTDDKKLISDAIAGMVSGLDPHSQYYDKKAFKEFKEETTGKFVGLGIEISQEDGLIRIVSPIEGSPADKAGLKAGDLIMRIDDKAVRGMTVNDAVKRMRGTANTKVTLTIYRKDESRTFPVTITRAEIITRSVRSKMVEPGYAWVRISQFQERTVEDFVAKVNALYQENPEIKGIVLDLRNDPGGLLNAAVAISAAFLPEGVDVVSTKGQLNDSNTVYKAIPQDYRQSWLGKDALQNLPQALKKVPLVVLVNEGSASASEIVAGALQDYKRATIMGSQTFGKGSVQSVRALGPETGLKITTARYYTPSGKSIQATGIVPDVMVDESEKGNIYAALRERESDLEHHISNGQGSEKPADPEREKQREEALKKLDAESKANPKSLRLPEFGSEKDFPLIQALNQLKGLPVAASKTQTVRKADDKDKAEEAAATEKGKDSKQEKSGASSKPAEGKKPASAP
ncbi:MAG: PDZ domain-containing protein [Brachymonas sp.]|jgi:carboxyl-terminal processing protease|nr:PDZ domain-containing protein [Brachymonas sp.]MBP6138778.1 PDZ domain-containing protein [Brachymonas sp.]MBP6966010.1 PDZ domain-containing protein [Brachymonas sp.]MBP7739994.1 PDZ domain-containing protein [Brachymonas sp.]MBP8596571.1 PDZ domain-containing protein [Brachymonas sp.]